MKHLLCSQERAEEAHAAQPLLAQIVHAPYLQTRAFGLPRSPGKVPVGELSAVVLGSSRVRRVEELLLAWFSQNGRDLPWRKNRDPYAILISEVMSQQTPTERVVPRWERWLERWPTIGALAAAPAADVIREWQGLGYNRRALALHRAAQQVASHGWPEDLSELPGVGRYTADAVACFAFGRPILPVDVNVRRVSERTGHTFSPAAAQALMDLGKSVCVARVPRCDSCPLAVACPSRGLRFEPLRRQGRFEGSFRQRRAAALREVVAGSQPEDGEAVASLARDGLVRVDGEAVSLPE
jgi:A/G-specific adenine glycosylase